MARDVVDRLDVDVFDAAEHGQSRALRGAVNLAADPMPDAPARFLPIDVRHRLIL